MGRQWRSSTISPFAGNVRTILYNCQSSFKLKLLVNEKEVLLPGCSSVYCDLDQVASLYEPDLQCPFFEMCYPNSSPCEFYCGSNHGPDCPTSSTTEEDNKWLYFGIGIGVGILVGP